MVKRRGRQLGTRRELAVLLIVAGVLLVLASLGVRGREDQVASDAGRSADHAPALAMDYAAAVLVVAGYGVLRLPGG